VLPGRTYPRSSYKEKRGRVRRRRGVAKNVGRQLGIWAPARSIGGQKTHRAGGGERHGVRNELLSRGRRLFVQISSDTTERVIAEKNARRPARAVHASQKCRRSTLAADRPRHVNNILRQAILGTCFCCLEGTWTKRTHTRKRRRRHDGGRPRKGAVQQIQTYSRHAESHEGRSR